MCTGVTLFVSLPQELIVFTVSYRIKSARDNGKENQALIYKIIHKTSVNIKPNRTFCELNLAT